MAGIMDLFGNKLFLQMLAGMGPEIAAGGSGARSLSAIMQQNISGQSMMGLIQKMLGGEVGEGGGFKMDDKNFTMNIPKFEIDKLKQEDGWGGGFGMSKDNWEPPSPSPGPGNVPVPTEPNLPTASAGGGGMLEKLLNPSLSLPNISGADLAGLSTADISNALSGSLNVKKLDQKKVTDLMDMVYKGSLTDLNVARSGEIRGGDPLDSNYPIRHWQTGPMSLRQWKALPTDEKEYSAYSQATIKKGIVPMTKEEFENKTPTEKIKTLQQLYDKPELRLLQEELTHPAESGKVTWTTATKELTKRYRIDPTGQFAVTPEIQWAHKEAQRILTELKDQGIEPLKAVNQAYDMADKKQRLIEKRYKQYLDAANEIRNSSKREAKIEEINSLFYETYKYLPYSKGD